MDFNTDIFTSDKERAEAKQLLPTLVDHPAWKILTRVFDLNITALDEQLHTREDFKELSDVYRLQDRLADLEQFKTLPKTLLEAATEPEGPTEEEIYD